MSLEQMDVTTLNFGERIPKVNLDSCPEVVVQLLLSVGLSLIVLGFSAACSRVA